KGSSRAVSSAAGLCTGRSSSAHFLTKPLLASLREPMKPRSADCSLLCSALVIVAGCSASTPAETGVDPLAGAAGSAMAGQGGGGAGSSAAGAESMGGGSAGPLAEAGTLSGGEAGPGAIEDGASSIAIDAAKPSNF